MNTLIAILVALIVIGVLLWAINKVLGVVTIPEPFKTIIWVIVVLIAVLVFLEMSGLYHFKVGLRSTPREQIYRVGNEPVVVNLANWTAPATPDTPACPHPHSVRRSMTLDEEKALYAIIKGRSLGTFTQTQTKPRGAMPYAQ